MNASNFCKEV